MNIKVNTPPDIYTQDETNKMPISNIKYREFLNNSSKHSIIPGLLEGAIPQGLCYSKERDLLIVSSYHNGNAPSSLHLINFETGNLVKSILLKNKDNTEYIGHAGGLAVYEDILWLSDDYKIYEYDLDVLIASNNMSFCKPKNVYATEVKADFANFSNNILWVGEYYYKNIYKTKKTHQYALSNGERNNGLVFGYSVNKNGKVDYERPNYIISIPNRVQGISFLKNDQIILSQSFWSFQSSNISVFNNILNSTPYSTIRIKDKDVPLWFLSKNDLVYQYNIPPMSEGIDIIDEKVYILFESASVLYKYYTNNSVNHIMQLKLK